MKRALLVEDDRDIAEAIVSELALIHLKVDHVSNGVDGVRSALANEYVLIILDLMLPELEGTEVCRQIRAEDKTTPIIVLTARNQEADKVLLLELGADDFITKPFGIAEFRARIKAAIRRGTLSTGGTDEQSVLRHGELTIDPERRKVTRDGVLIPLTAREFEYVYALAETPGRIYTRDTLASIVHGYEAGDFEHSVSSAINRIRAKLEPNPSKPQYVITVRGVGYKFAEIEDE